MSTDDERGGWTIQYNGGKVRYSTERTDEALARISPDFLAHMLQLIGRPSSTELRALVSEAWSYKSPGAEWKESRRNGS